jgi:glycosyltransferase involved in cell wall biosynthesis
VRIALIDPPGFTPPYDHSLASALARRGNDVDLLTSPSALFAEPEPDGYRRDDVYLPRSSRRPRSRVRSALRGLEYVPSARRAERLLGELAPDVVHVQWLGIAPYDVRWLRRVARVRPTILTAHDVFPRRRFNARGWHAALTLADRVVVHSDRAADELAATGIPRDRIVRIPHPVFDAAPGSEPGEPSGTTLLHFGLLRSYKGLDVLIRALPAVAREVPGVRLVVAGHPFDPVEPLRALAEQVGAGELVEWRLGFVPESEVPALFGAAAAVVCPYLKLDSSGVLATALGYGRPAVVSDVGSLGTTVREFGAGRAVTPGDPEALAAACAELLTDPAALADAARGAREARATLTWDASAAEHERLYEAVRRERA